MSDKNLAGTSCGCDTQNIREAVCIHTKKITDSCRDKDCIEDLRVYLTRDSQAILDRSCSVKARCAELLHVYIDVEPISYNQGYYTIDLTYYYRIIADATVSNIRPATVYGLAVFTKRAILCGGTGSSKSFTSSTCNCSVDSIKSCSCPEAVVDVVDPVILGATLEDACNCHCCRPEPPCDLPAAICACFDDELVLGGEAKRLLVTLGQFSIIRLQRDTQLLIPAYDYCLPTKDCDDTAIGPNESPCDLFSRIAFPVDEFFPTSCDTNSGCGFNSNANSNSNGCSYRTCGN